MPNAVPNEASNAAKLKAPTVMIGHPLDPDFSETTIHFSLIFDQMMRCIRFMT
jgi:hypothetical protein